MSLTLPAKGALAVFNFAKFLFLCFPLLLGQLFALLQLLFRLPADLFSIFDALFFTSLKAASTAVVWGRSHPASDSTTCGFVGWGRGGGELLLLGLGTDHGLAADVVGDLACLAAAYKLVFVFCLVSAIRGVKHLIDRFQKLL